jgi:hypothetical protein
MADEISDDDIDASTDIGRFSIDERYDFRLPERNDPESAQKTTQAGAPPEGATRTDHPMKRPTRSSAARSAITKSSANSAAAGLARCTRRST